MLLRPLLARRRVSLPRVVVTCCRRWHSHVAEPALSLRTCTVSCAPSRQLTANSMSQWRVAGSGSRTVRSFLHTGHEKGTDEDEGVWHQRQLAVVVDDWRERNNGTEPSAESLDQMSSLLEDLTRMHSAQNSGVLPADADVRTWFGISASEDMASAASSGKRSADAAAEELKLKNDAWQKEWLAEMAKLRDQQPPSAFTDTGIKNAARDLIAGVLLCVSLVIVFGLVAIFCF